jgi:hypothetical protein
VVRLVVLTALLALYPLSVLVLQLVDAREEPVARPELELREQEPTAACGRPIELVLHNVTAEPLRLQRLSLMVMAGEQPLLTRFEEGDLLARRAGPEGEVARGEIRRLGPFCLDLPPGVDPDVTMATLSVVATISGESLTVSEDWPPDPGLPRP